MKDLFKKHPIRCLNAAEMVVGAFGTFVAAQFDADIGPTVAFIMVCLCAVQTAMGLKNG